MESPGLSDKLMLMQQPLSSILIPKPPIFSFSECRWYLDRNYDDCLYRLEPEAITRLLPLRDRMALVRLSNEAEHLRVEVLDSPLLSAEEGKDVEAYVVAWFDLKRDIAPFYQLLQQDKEFADLAQRYQGLRLVGIPDLFECLCWSIIGQQINLSFAYRLKRRLVEACGTKLVWQGTTFYAFPTPAQLLSISPQQFQAFQFSGRKAEYLLEVSRLFLEGKISKAGLAKLEPEEQYKQLVAIKGVGEWTAHYTLMKCMGILSSVPYGDAGLLNAWKHLKALPAKPSRDELVAGMAKFRGWQAYLVFYLWRSLSSPVFENE